jgi:hypothetical protein
MYAVFVAVSVPEERINTARERFATRMGVVEVRVLAALTPASSVMAITPPPPPIRKWGRS